MTDERALALLFHEVLDREDAHAPFQRLAIELEKPGASRRRRGRRIFMKRNQLVLLAAALVLLLGISVVISARIFNMNRGGHSIPAGPDQKAVAQLLMRPLDFQYPRPDLETCASDGPFTGELLGIGPVYGYSGGTDALTTTTWGQYGHPSLITAPDQPGPIVMRAINLRTGQLASFLEPNAGGPVAGTDELNGKTVQRYEAAVLDTAHSPAATFRFNDSTWVEWHITHGWPRSQGGFCAGLQIDGPDFSETLYATVT